MSQPSLHKSPDEQGPPSSDAADEKTAGGSGSDAAAEQDGTAPEVSATSEDNRPVEPASSEDEPSADVTVEVTPDQAMIANLRQLLGGRERDLAAKDEQLKGYITAYKQATADMDRERDRLARDRERALDQDRMAVAADLLDVLDNLERSRNSVADGGQLGDLVKGLDMVHEQFLAALARLGVERITALGQSFDASIHEATGMVPASGDQGDQEVIHEERSGYLLRGRLLRPSRVIVATSGE